MLEIVFATVPQSDSLPSKYTLLSLSQPSKALEPTIRMVLGRVITVRP